MHSVRRIDIVLNQNRYAEQGACLLSSCQLSVQSLRQKQRIRVNFQNSLQAIVTAVKLCYPIKVKQYKFFYRQFSRFECLLKLINSCIWIERSCFLRYIQRYLWFLPPLSQYNPRLPVFFQSKPDWLQSGNFPDSDQSSITGILFIFPPVIMDTQLLLIGVSYFRQAAIPGIKAVHLSYGKNRKHRS